MKRENKLLQYSSLAVSFIFLNVTHGEVIYTDLEPDIVLEFDYEAAGIDLDDNGDFDFFFSKSSGTYYFWNGCSSVLRSRQALWAGPYISQNAIVGYYNSPGSEAGYGIHLPIVLEFGELINSDRNFQNEEFQILCYGHYGFFNPEGSFHTGGGDWHDELEGIEDGYLGVKFIDDDENYHYGWIRCTTSDSCKRITIKDYAYNEVPLEGLYAGELISTVEEINSLDANVYSYNKSIFINLNEFVNEIEIHIYDLNGKIIYSDQLVNSSTQIELNEAKGVYFVELIDGEKKFREKIYIN